MGGLHQGSELVVGIRRVSSNRLAAFAEQEESTRKSRWPVSAAHASIQSRLRKVSD